MASPSVVSPDVTQLTALTHPLRLRLLGLLRLHGFVEHAPELGTPRERWWRASARLTTVTARPGGDEGREVTGAFHEAVVTTNAAQAQRAVAERRSLPTEWAVLTASSDAVVRVTPAQADEIRHRLEPLVRQVVDEFPRPTGAAGEDTRLYEVQVQAFPVPGQMHG